MEPGAPLGVPNIAHGKSVNIPLAESFPPAKPTFWNETAPKVARNSTEVPGP